MTDHASPRSQEISDEIARTYKLRNGRGPTRITTTIERDLVVCVLQDTRTPQEATLIEAGAQDLVGGVRARFQAHVAAGLIEAVERVTGRPVAGHVPGYTPEIDVAVELFVLGDGPLTPA